VTNTPRAQPTFFGAVDRPLFGWIHRTASAGGATRTPLGLVLCNPFGYEAMCTHRTVRHFAQAAAAAGIPALRFDYDGTGDSAGTDLDPGRRDAWLASIHEAIETLRRECGCERVCLLGIRLGATLAAVAASSRTDVAGLIAIAPVINAKAFIREMRALQMATVAGAAAAGSPSTDTPMEITGFLLSLAARNELSQMDLMKLPRAPAPAVLVLDRSDLPGAQSWYQHLRSCDARASYHALPGYVEMMLSPHSARVPQEMLQNALEWLTVERAQLMSADPTASLQATAPESRSCAQFNAPEGSGAQIVETAAFLDPEQTLFGILTLPAASHSQLADPSDVAKSSSRPAVLLLNAGGTHHIGPNRMYVALARRWASLGHAVLRMDISGIGDSLPWPGEAENVVYTAHATEDIGWGLRYLREQTGATELRALGLCSGAYHAFKAAVNGAPLQAIVMINPLTFFWKEGSSLEVPTGDARIVSEARRYRSSALSADRWLKLMRGDVNILTVAGVLTRRFLQQLKYSGRNLARLIGLPLRDDLARELELIVRRRIGLTLVFAARDPGIELLEIQGGSKGQALRKRGRMKVHIIDNADHTFTVQRTRDHLAALLTAELDTPAPTIRPAPTPGANPAMPAIEYP
jgi:alpha/beta superfamily hydrolase